MSEQKRSHFCAGIYLRQGVNGWEVLGATSVRFPREVKFPGGTNKHSPWETKEQTLEREYSEETGLKPVKFNLVLEVDAKYLQYFFVISAVEGEFSGVKSTNETDGDKISVRWWGIDEFFQCSFKNHRPAFLKVCQTLASRVSGFLNNAPSLERALGQMG